MTRDLSQTTLYHLIEAGQLAHRTLVLPLAEMGLYQGDDAIILALPKTEALSNEMLCTGIGLDPDSLEPRLERLLDLNLIRRMTMEDGFTPAIILTGRGSEVRDKLCAHWQELEDALMGELKPKQQRRLEAIMSRFADLLAL